MGLLRKSLDLNVRISNAFDRMLPAALRLDGNGCFLAEYMPRVLQPGTTVWDVGSGSQPCISGEDRTRLGIKVVGLDISDDELAAAPAGAYSSAVIADVCSYSGDGSADNVICQALLEHVPDTAGAIRALATITAPGGRIYLFVPCRNALFARVNLALPQELKKKILFALFPSKATGHEGFKVWYDHCTPGAIAELARQNGLEVEESRRFWISSYFKPLAPAFIAWRLLQGITWLFIRQEAAETFVCVLRKPQLSR